MKKEINLTVVENRCDRCSVLFSVYHVVGDRKTKVKDGLTVSVGPFKMVIGSGRGAVELFYDNICETCASRAFTMMDRMGKVDRTRGGWKRKKK